LRGRIRFSSFFFLFFAAVLLTGCQQYINYPAPRIATLSPTSISAGQPTFTLTVTGYNFTPASTVQWNGVALGAIFVNTNTLTVQVSSTLIQNPGAVNVIVVTPAPGGGTTAALTFTINPVASPTPQISGTSPESAVAGSAAFTLSVSGTNFVSLSVVNIGNVALQTTFIGPTFLQVTVPADSVSRAGTLQLTVVNPATPSPGGGSSNVYTFQVNNPLPGVTSISPASVAAGGTSSTITVTGTGFVSNSVVLINGASRTTSAASATSVSAVLNAADLATGGVNRVQVMNPGPGGGTSNAVTFAVDPTTTAGLPILVDYAFDGSQANAGVCGGPANCASGALGLTLGSARPSVDTSGALVVFASISNNLVANQVNGASQVFVRDTCLGGTCTPSTFTVSVAADGTAANGPSFEPSTDTAAAHAAYTSRATNVVNYVSAPAGVRQVYWQPVCATGSTPSSTGSTGTSGAVAACAAPSTTAGSSIGGGVLVSLGADGNPGNADSYNPVLSPDGQFVAFVSLATNLVSGVTVDGVTPQIYLRTICSGATPLSLAQSTTTSTCTPTTYLVSSPDGITPGNGPSSHPVIGNTGTFVSFVSSASNLGAPNSNQQEIFRQDECQLATPGCVPTMTLISTPDGATPAGGVNSEPTMSFDGRFVAFSSTALNLGVATGGVQQIFVRDTCTGATSTCTPATELVSTPNGTSPANGASENPNINSASTGSGQFIAFASQASNLSTNAANGVENIYIRNTCNTLATSTTACVPTTVLASHPAGTLPSAANGNSVEPAISADGHTVAFISSATNLVQLDTNALEDIFLGATSF